MRPSTRLFWYALAFAACNCRGDTRDETRFGGGSSPDAGGACRSGACSPPLPDGGTQTNGGGGTNTVPPGDASVPDDITERKFCGFDGAEFTTYRFPSGEPLGALNVPKFRTLGNVVGVDSAHNEILVQSCVQDSQAVPPAAAQSSCSLDAFAADAGFAPPLRSIPLSPNQSISSIVVDSSNDNLIVFVFETDGNGSVVSRRIITVARGASDLTTPVREFSGNEGDAGSLQLDPVRGELYVLGATEIRIYARDANGNAAPLRTMPRAELLLSPAHGEYHLWLGDSLETYPLPAPAAPGTLPLRTLTLPPDTYGYVNPFIDDTHQELWVRNATIGVGAFDLTASGAAAALRSRPFRVGVPVGVLQGEDEVVFRRFQGDVAAYARTAVDGTASRVVEGAAGSPQTLLAVDGQRDEVFFLSESGIVTVYALGASGSAAPLRRLGTLLVPGTALFDQGARELLTFSDAEPFLPRSDSQRLRAYPAGAEGQPAEVARFTLDVSPDVRDFTLAVIDPAHEQLLGVIGASGYEAVEGMWTPSYAVYSLSGARSYPPVPIPSRRGPSPKPQGFPEEDPKGRIVSVTDLVYDSNHDEVVLGLTDCYIEVGVFAEALDYIYDCHYELRSYPRANRGLSPYKAKALDVSEEVRALDYDAENDLLMVSGQSHVFFFDYAARSGTTLPGYGPDAGPSDITAPDPITREPAYEFPLAGIFKYCD